MISNEELSKSATEINEILRNAPNSLSANVPNEIKQYFKETESKTHEFKYDLRKKPYEQNITKLTKIILCEMYLEYMCSEARKQNIKDFILKELQTTEVEKEKIYNYDDLFKKSRKNIQL